MSRGFLRPEALGRLLAWREAAIGAGAVALGLWWGFGATGIMRWVGVVLALGGVGILREGVLRLRRPKDGGGAGVVSVTERQITYLSGPGGGVVSADSLALVAIERHGTGAPVWMLGDREGNSVAIPADAENAGALYDALGALPGLGQDHLVRAVRETAPGRRVLWRATPERLG